MLATLAADRRAGGVVANAMAFDKSPRVELVEKTWAIVDFEATLVVENK